MGNRETFITLTEDDIHYLDETKDEMLSVITQMIILGMYEKGVWNTSGIVQYVKDNLQIIVPDEYVEAGKLALKEKGWLNNKWNFTSKGKKMVNKILSKFLSV